MPGIFRKMKIAVINITHGGMSGGYRKYLLNMIPRMARHSDVGNLLCASPLSMNIKDFFGPLPRVQFVTCKPFSLLRDELDTELEMHLRMFSPDVILVLLEEVKVVCLYFGLYIFIGYQYASRRIRKMVLLILAVFMVLFLLIGMYSTPLYRTFKTATVGYIEGRVNLSENYGIFLEALFTTSPNEIIEETLYALWNRIDAITPAALMIARGEDMRILERAFGIENNIISTILHGFVPRFLWPTKPVISSRAFSEISYGNPINQPEISYLVDLYRNLGVVGIFPGMVLIGIYLRITYKAFIRARGPTSIGIFIYLPFLMLVNYEQLYADFIPMVWRTLLIVTVTLVIINWVIRILVKRI